MAQLDLQSLRTLVAVADEGSITGAAERVSRTQAAVSMQINKLERLLDRPLLRRLPRGVELTPAGEQLLGYARRMVRLEQEAVHVMSRPPLKGTVRIGTPDDYAHCFLPAILARFHEHEPEIAVEVHCQTSEILREELRQGRLDLVMVTCAGDDPGGRVLVSEPVVFAAARGSRLQEAEVLPLALWLPGCPIRAMALRALEEARIEYRAAYTSPSNAALLAAVSRGLAVGVMARSTLTADLVVLGADQGLPPLGHIQIAILRNASRASPVTDELHNHIVESFASLERGDMGLAAVS